MWACIECPRLKWKPLLCIGIHPGATVIDSTPPSLEGRIAKCSCGHSEPSSTNLAFFEYCGKGSHRATVCKCGYAYVAHTVEGMANNVPSNRRTVIETGKCKTGYQPSDGQEFDSYYCGCRGWD